MEFLDGLMSYYVIDFGSFIEGVMGWRMMLVWSMQEVTGNRRKGYHVSHLEPHRHRLNIKAEAQRPRAGNMLNPTEL